MRDFVLLALFLVVTAWSVYRLFLPRSRPQSPPPPALRPARNAPDPVELARRIREAKPLAPTAAWRPRRLSNRWRWIVIHHSATFSGNAAAFDRYHARVRHMSHGLAYHFVIGNGRGSGDGEVEVGERWRRQLPGGHVRGEELNRQAIGICLVGDFDESIPTLRQLAALKGLLKYLFSVTGVKPDHVVGHTDLPGQATACPGRYLPVRDIVASVRATPASAAGERRAARTAGRGLNAAAGSPRPPRGR